MTSGTSTSPAAAVHARHSSALSGSAHRHHPVRSPSDRRSPHSKSHSPSPERHRKRANSSRGQNGHALPSKSSNGHDDSEAETDILSDEEQTKTKPKKRLVKNEPKDDADTTVSVKARSEPMRSHDGSRASSVNGDAHERKERKSNGVHKRENGHAKTIMNDKIRNLNDLSTKSSSRAQSADATTSPTDNGDRSRQAHSAEPRKRKFSDAQRPSKLEPPRQKPRLDDGSRPSKTHQRRPSSPPTPGTPGLRSSHRRSASTQSAILSAGLSGTRKRRDFSGSSLPPIGKEWATSDMSSDEAASYPPIPKLAPPPRSGRAAYRAMTSPARTAPIGKRADKFGSTPLARACEKGNFAAVKQAYEEAPGEINQSDNGGFAPLQKAALEGHTEIVQFLLEKGCRKDCCSKDEQDTPLIDAVENGHTEVVQLLLEYGVNPHHQNKSGKRAIDAVDDDEDYASDMRKMLQRAMQEYVGSESDSDDDNQDFPLIRPEDKNRSDLLYLEPNRTNLLDYARKGDVVAVDHFLSSVKPGNEHAVVAARAGHHLVLNLLLASAGDQLEKDPDPLKYEETPLVAAIGRGHLKVIRLLIQQDNFNPTRKTADGKTYWEIAEDRKGPRWQVERDLLKEYYDAYLAKRTVQRKKKVHDPERRPRPKEPSSSPQAIKERKAPRKPTTMQAEPRETSKEGKRKFRPVLESSDSENSGEEMRSRKKQHTRRESGMSKSSKEGNTSPTMRRQSPGSKAIKREDSKGAGESSKPTSRKPSSEKRHSTDSKVEEKAPTPKASTPEAVREARKAEVEAKALKAAEEAAEAERQRLEAAEAAAREEARKAEEERLRKEKEELERKEQEERERREQAEREERERRVAALPIALRIAVQKSSSRPLYWNSRTKDHGEELGPGVQFLPIHTTPLQHIEVECSDDNKDDLWILNFQVVGLLGLPSELRMEEFADWERRPVTDDQRERFLRSYDLSKLAQHFRWPYAGEPGYDYRAQKQQLDDTRIAFMQMQPLCWVRYADFEKALSKPEYKHLQELKIKTLDCRLKSPDPDDYIDFSSSDDEAAQPAKNNGADKKVDSVTDGISISSSSEEKKASPVL